MMQKKTKEKKRVLSICCLFCTLLLLLCSCSSQTGFQTATQVKNVNTLSRITIGSDNYPPFNYEDADGNPTGIDVELATEAFRRMGYQAVFKYINWEEKTDLVNSGEIDCIWSCFTMDGREDEYQWAGPYMVSHQVVAVNVDSDIYTLQDLEDKVMAVQSTTKPEEILRSHAGGIPSLRKVISVQKRELMFLMLSKGYVDAIGAHDTSVEEFMAECDLEFRILEEPLQTVGLGVAFDRTDTRGLDRALDETLKEMRADGTTKNILEKYLSDVDRYMGDAYGE